MEDLKIEVLYTCMDCGLVDIPVKVRARGEGEDLNRWMKHIGYELASNHQARSPRCFPKTFTNIKIPYTGEGPVGGPTIN